MYRAYTTPELVRRWWSGGRGEVTVCDIGLRVGGRWRYGGDGTLNTATFTEVDGRTTLELLTQTASREVRDMILESGMEFGLQDGMDLMERIAISLK